MAFDDETIRIQVDGAQANRALEDLAEDVRLLEQHLAALNKESIKTGVEFDTVTRNLSKARERFAEASKGVQGFGQSAQSSALNMKDLTKSIGAGISIIGILQENIRALGPALEDLGKGIKFAAESAGADAETMTNLGRALDSLIHPSHIAANAVESMREAWKKLIDTMVESSTVIPNTSQSIEDSLKILEAARKKAAQGTEDSAKQEEEALRATQKAEEDLEKAALKSAEERAKAEAKAAEEIVAALEKERIALDAKLAQDQARLSSALAKGAPLDTSEDTGEAKAALADLRQEIKRLEDTPMIDPAQLNALNEMKDRAAKLGREVQDLNNVFTVGSDNWLNDADAANAAAAAQDVYGDMLAQAQMRHEDAIRTSEDAADALSQYTDEADGAAEALGEVADAAGKIGEEAKKGGDKAGESMDKLKEGLTEAIPLANELKGILAEIVALGAQADI